MRCLSIGLPGQTGTARRRLALHVQLQSRQVLKQPLRLNRHGSMFRVSHGMDRLVNYPMLRSNEYPHEDRMSNLGRCCAGLSSCARALEDNTAALRTPQFLLKPPYMGIRMMKVVPLPVSVSKVSEP
jgi:hypothetical protein